MIETELSDVDLEHYHCSDDIRNTYDTRTRDEENDWEFQTVHDELNKSMGELENSMEVM